VQLLKFYLLLSFTLFSKLTYCQVLDSVSTIVTYDFLYSSDSTKRQVKRDDILNLEIGSKWSKCYSLYRQIRDSILSGQFNEQQLSGATRYSVNLAGFNKNGPSTKYFKQINAPKFTITDKLGLNSYIIYDTATDMIWRVTSDTVTINNYLCTKAITRFRGRNYEAWFAIDIPLPCGPLKFGGLPGLILRLKDDQDNFYFQCRSISFLPKKTPLIMEKGDYLKASRKEFRHLYRFMLENPDAFMASQGLQVSNVHCEGCPTPVKPTFNPIELD
jgi:GLPGLI family protein